MNTLFFSKKFYSTLCLLLSALSFSIYAHAQSHNPIKWSFTTTPSKNNPEASLIFTATLDSGWHIYSQFMEEGGPLPTKFTFTQNDAFVLKGKVQEEGKAIKSYDSTFMIDVTWYSGAVTFIQKVKLKPGSATVKGEVEFMVCNKDLCLPPATVPFSLEVKGQL